jgi:glucose-1-phosphate adenylyltransferase
MPEQISHIPDDFNSENEQALCLIMAGGNGTRLRPLTDHCPKPAIQLGDSNHLIDPAIVASSLVATEIIVASRNDTTIAGHLHDMQVNYRQAKEQGLRGSGYVVFENKDALEADGAESIIIIPADYLHDIDFNTVLAHHRQSGADLTLLSKIVSAEFAIDREVLHIIDGNIKGFSKKGYGEVAEMNPEISTGIYVFQKNALLAALHDLEKHYPDFCDIGYDLLPQFFAHKNARNFTVTGFWDDMGTVDRYYSNNMLLLDNTVAPTRYLSLHPETLCNSLSLIAPSAEVHESAIVENSIIGSGVTIAEGCSIKNSILMAGSILLSGAGLDLSIVSENQRVHAIHESTLTDSGISLIS